MDECSDVDRLNNMQFFLALYPQTSSKRFTYYYPGTPVHTNTSTPQWSIQPRYTRQVLRVINVQ